MTTKVTCNRCGGSGKTVFMHIADGVCFACNGVGKITYTHNNVELDNFFKRGAVHIDGVPCKMIMGCNNVAVGGEFVAKCINDCVIIWNKKACANWHFEVPKVHAELLKTHFARI